MIFHYEEISVKKAIFKIGDKCHIFHGRHQGQTTEGTIVNVFEIEGNYANPFYVIAIPGYIEDEMVVRSSSVFEVRRLPVNLDSFDELDY